MSESSAALDREPAAATLDVVVEAGDGWAGVIPAGGIFRIVDLHGNQAADTLFYDAHDRDNRYDAQLTLARNGGIYLTTGSVLYSSEGDELLRIVDDTCGRHDTLGGACSRESNVVRYGDHVRDMHACRDTFTRLALEQGMEKRDLTSNVNFFMNVPVTPAGELTFADGISAPGKHVEMEMARDVLVLISNCPQLNNPCNAYDPTPIRLLSWPPS